MEFLQAPPPERALGVMSQWEIGFLESGFGEQIWRCQFENHRGRGQAKICAPMGDSGLADMNSLALCIVINGIAAVVLTPDCDDHLYLLKCDIITNRTRVFVFLQFCLQERQSRNQSRTVPPFFHVSFWRCRRRRD